MNISVDSMNSKYYSIDGILYERDNNTLIRYPEGRITDEFEIPDNVTSIGDNAFNGCKYLKKINISKNVKMIGSTTFDGLRELECIIVDEDNEIFETINCVLYNKVERSLIRYPEGKGGSYDIQDNTKTIKSKAFYNCDKVTNVNIPDSVISIGRSTFEGCNKLNNVKLPINLTEIEDRTFYGCENLNNINIPEHVEIIGKETFYGCNSLNRIRIPKNVISIGEHSFSECNNLSKIEVDNNNIVYKSNDGVVFTIDTSSLYIYPPGRNGYYNIPNDTKSISSNAFKDCKRLSGINIPSSVFEIEDHAFSGCENLKNITIEEGLNRIGEYSFSNCKSLTTLSLPSTVSFINNYAFSGCTNLISVSYEGNSNPSPSGYEGIFSGCDSLHHICVPKNYYNDNKRFCGNPFYCATDSCESLQFESDHCYEEKCLYGDKITLERENATEWKKKSSACVEYICDKDKGAIMRRVCNKEYICMNDGCLPRNYQKYSVEIEFDNLTANDVNSKDIYVEIEHVTGIDQIEVGLELSEDAHIIHIIVIVEDKESGNKIANVLNQCVKSNNYLNNNITCEGILGHVRSAKLVEPTSELSDEPDYTIYYIICGIVTGLILMMAIVIIIMVKVKTEHKSNETMESISLPLIHHDTFDDDTL